MPKVRKRLWLKRHCEEIRALLHGYQNVMAKPRSGCDHPGYPEYMRDFIRIPKNLYRWQV